MSHREKEWTEDYKTKQWKSRRHRRCIERRSLFANSISNLYTKRLSQNSYQESVRYTSVALCAVGTSVTLHNLRPLRDSVCPLYKPFNLSSIFRKNLLLPCYRVSYYSVTMSYITLLPCLPLLCYHVSYYPVPCLTLPCYYVLHYPVSSRNAKPQKRVDKLIIPRTIPLKTINLSTRLLVYSST